MPSVHLRQAPRQLIRLPTKRLLNREEALGYCGLPHAALLPVHPKRVRPGKQGLRYDIRDLDRWIDELDTEASAGPTEEEILARLD